MREIKKILFAISLLLFSNTVFAAGGVGDACPCNQGLWCNSAGPVCMSCTTGYTDNPDTGLTDPTQCYKHCNPIGPSTTPQFLNGTWNPDVINVNWSSSLPGCTYTNTNEITCNNTYFLSGNSCSSCPSCNVSNGGSATISTISNNCSYAINCPTGYHTGTNNCTTIGNATCDGNTYLVTFNTVGGSGGSAFVTATYGSSMPSATMPTKSGSKFDGYFDATNGGTQYYTSSGTSARTWNKTNAETLYAQWSTCTPCNTSNASCTLNTTGNTCNYVTACNQGYGNIVNNGEFNASCTVCTPCATQHTSSCIISTVSNNCTYTTTCEANYSTTNPNQQNTVCTPNTYTITLNDSANGGSGGDGTIKEVYNTKWTSSGGATITSLNNLPTKPQSMFTGYFSLSSGGTQRIQATGDLPLNTTLFNDGNTTSGAATLYAQFASCPAGNGNGTGTVTTVADNNTCRYYISCNPGLENEHYNSSNLSLPNENSLTCTACSAGYYCDGTVGVQHKACPTGKTNTSSSSSTSSASCYIKGGTSAAGTTHFCDGSNNCFYLPVDINY